MRRRHETNSTTLRLAFFLKSVAALALLGLAGAPARAQTYSICEVGALKLYNQTQGNSINNSGQVAGSAYDASGLPHAFLYTPGSTCGTGTMLDLNSIAQNGFVPWGSTLNNSGQITGYGVPSTGGFHAFFYTPSSTGGNGSLCDLGMIDGGNSFGNAVNDAGQIAGTNYVGNTIALTFTETPSASCTPNAMTPVPALASLYSVSSGINGSGQIAGAFLTPTGATHAYLLNNGSLADLGTLGGTSSYANWINGAGQVVGSAQIAFGYNHAFLYGNGSMADLGTLGGDESFAFGINSAGVVAGQSDITGGTLPHAFVYTNSMLDLNSLLDPSSPLAGQVTLESAAAINDNGQIVATGVDTQSTWIHSYVLTPLPGSPPPCRPIGKFITCILRPVFFPCAVGNGSACLCPIICFLDGLRWSPPVFPGSDSWVNGTSIEFQASTPEQARGVAVGLEVTLNSEPASVSGVDEASDASRTTGTRAVRGRVRAIGPTVEITAASNAPDEVRRLSVPSTAPALKLALPFVLTGKESARNIRMVSFNSATNRWEEVKMQSMNDVKHQVVGRVAAGGKYTVVVESGSKRR